MTGDDREFGDFENLPSGFFALLVVLADVEPAVLWDEINGKTALARAIRKILKLKEPTVRGRGRPANDTFNWGLVLYVEAAVASGQTIDAALKRVLEQYGDGEDDPNRFETLRTRYKRARRAFASATRPNGIADWFVPSVDQDGT